MLTEHTDARLLTILFKSIADLFDTDTGFKSIVDTYTEQKKY